MTPCKSHKERTGRDIPMARADDMANARPMYLDAMESANGTPRWATLSRPKKRPLPSGNVLVLNHAERVDSRMMKRARGPRSLWYRRSTSSAAPWTREESQTRQNERARKDQMVANGGCREARKKVTESRACGRSAKGFVATPRRGKACE